MANPIANNTPYVAIAQNLVGRTLGFNQRPVPNPSPAGVNTFNAVMGKRGLARTNRYFVFITIPPILQRIQGFQHVDKEIMLMCESTALPGISLAMSEGRRYGVGPVDRRPVTPIFTDLSMSFYGDSTNLIHRFFYSWINNTVNFDAKNISVVGSSTQGNNSGAFRVAYRDDYATTVTIMSYNERHEEITKIELNRCFPYQIGDAPMAYGDSDSIVRFPITFHFWNWQMVNVNVDNILLDSKMAPKLNILERIYKTTNAILAIKSLKKPSHIGDIINVVNNARIILENF